MRAKTRYAEVDSTKFTPLLGTDKQRVSRWTPSNSVGNGGAMTREPSPRTIELHVVDAVDVVAVPTCIHILLDPLF